MSLRELAESLELGMDEFLEIMELFVKKSTSDLDQLQAALDEGDGQKVMRAAHSIKGAAINIGLTEIYEITQQMEMEARENNLSGASRGVWVIREKLEKLVEILGKEGIGGIR